MSASILFVAPSAYSLGGVATWLDYLVPGLERFGWSVQVALASGQWHCASRYLSEHEGLRAFPFENPTGSREGRVRTLVRALRAARPDIVVVVNIPDAYEAVERLRRSSTQVRVAAALHAIEPEFFNDLREYRSEIDGVISTNRLGCRLAQVVAGYEPRVTHYAPCGVNVARLDHLPRQADRLEILFAGRLDEGQKRVSDLPLVAAHLVAQGLPFRLTIAGDGPDENALKQELNDLSSKGMVRWLGRVPQGRLVTDWLSDHHLLLVTSSAETGPIVAWEAMSAGLALVSSRFAGSGLESALVDGVNCRLFEIGDCEGAAQCIADLSDPLLRAGIARAGRRLVETRFSRRGSIEAWNTALESILGAGPPPSSRRQARRVPPAGRLDRLLGTALAETIRAAVGRRFLHTSPGGEWPHSYGGRSNVPEFRARALAIDRGVP